MCYYRKGDYATAISEGHKAERLRPKEQLVHTNLSLFYVKTGDKQKADGKRRTHQKPYSEGRFCHIERPPNGPGDQLPSHLADRLKRPISVPDTTMGRLDLAVPGQLHRLVRRRAPTAGTGATSRGAGEPAARVAPPQAIQRTEVARPG